MCAHNHSKGDAADPVDDHVSATVLWRTADALLDVPVAMQPGAPPEIPKHLKMPKIWRKPFPICFAMAGGHHVRLWQYDHHRCDGSDDD